MARRIGELFKVLVRAAQVVLRPLAFRDVARDLGNADDLALLITERRDGQRNIQQAAVLAQADRLEMVDALAALQAREDLPLFVLPVGRNHEHDRFCRSLPQPCSRKGAPRPGSSW